MKLDAEAQRIVYRLVDNAARQAELETEAAALKAELRQRLPIGTHSDDDGPLLHVQPNRRFSASRALTVLPPSVVAACYVPQLSSALVKEKVTPDIYRMCMDEYEPKIVLA
jgi:hypothetical protein